MHSIRSCHACVHVQCLHIHTHSCMYCTSHRPVVARVRVISIPRSASQVATSSYLMLRDSNLILVCKDTILNHHRKRPINFDKNASSLRIYVQALLYHLKGQPRVYLLLLLLMRFSITQSTYALTGKFKDQIFKLGICLPCMPCPRPQGILPRATVSKHNPALPRHYQGEQG